MNVLSLFSGIGGLELGLERAGMTVVGQVEINEFCRRVLAKHWPEVPRHDDVRTAVAWWRSERRPAVHVVAGGFPCQPASNAGRMLGTADPRWLWPACRDVVRALRPGWVVLENVAALRGRGAGDVLGDLAESGYDAEWDCLPAAAVGARHRRDRWICVAYPHGEAGRRAAGAAVAGAGGTAVHGRAPEPRRRGEAVADADGERQLQPARIFGDVGNGPRDCGWWGAEPDVGRVAYGVPGGVDRRRALGNAVVPQVAEYVGRLIVAADRPALCEHCAALYWRWLDSKPSDVLDVRLSFTYGSGAPYDASAAGVADGQRARYERWRSLVREQQAAIRASCAAGRHAAPTRVSVT